MTQAKVEAVNKRLQDGEPGNISIDEHSGYTGYKPQSLIDAMNAEFWGQWGFEELSSEIIPGEKGGLAVAQVRVWLKDVPDFHPTSYGQSRVTRGDVGDAKKGAQTDAIKKALSYLSIGNRAYHGLLNKEDSKGNSTQVRSIHAQQNNAKTAQTSNNATTAQAQNSNIPALIGSMKNRAKALGLATDAATFKALLQEATGEVLDEKDLTLARIAKINGHMTKIERERKTA